MPRNLSSSVLADLFSQEASKVYLILLRISHSGLTQPIHLVNNKEDVTSSVLGASQVYTRFAFRLTLPEDTETDTLSTASLAVDNVSSEIVNAVRSISSPPDIDFVVVEFDSPNVALVGPITMQLVNVSYDAFEVTGDLTMLNLFNEVFPKDAYTPSNTPGLF